jgi:transposase-like protein
MAQCRICSSEKLQQVNLRLLQGGQIGKTAREFGVSYQTIRHHRRFCLPWRDPRTAPAETCDQKFAELEYELRRLTLLGECGASVSGALAGVRERRHLLELEMRKEHLLGATHRKLFPAKMELDEDMEVIFENGRPRTVTVREAARFREAQERKQ